MSIIGSANLLVNPFSNLILICFPVFFGAAGIPAGQAPPGGGSLF